MKKLISSFADSMLSREQMKNFRGGYEQLQDSCGANICTETSDCKPMGCDGKTCTNNKCQ
jgi:hypothetical protein